MSRNWLIVSLVQILIVGIWYRRMEAVNTWSVQFASTNFAGNALANITDTDIAKMIMVKCVAKEKK